MKILHMFILCFLIAAILNVANFLVCYYIYYTKDITEHREKNDIQKNGIEDGGRTGSEYDDYASVNKKWDILSTMLLCGKNSTDCPSIPFEKINHGETTENMNGFYYYESNPHKDIRICPRIPPGLGPVKMDKHVIELNALEQLNSYIKPGGYFMPKRCIPRQSVAIIIPMQDVNRAWKNYIGTFLYYMHPFLLHQLSEYQIFVIVQAFREITMAMFRCKKFLLYSKGNPTERYARGKLLNSGFMEAQKMRKQGWDCLVFHDAHHIPMDTRNLYRCGLLPRRLLAETGNPEKLIIDKFGGAVAIRPTVFKKINGFSNIDWNEDGDYINMFERLKDWNYTIQTNVPSIGQYTTLKPFPYNMGQTRVDKSHETTPIYTIDGISSLWYEVVKTELKRLFTFIQVDFHIPA